MPGEARPILNPMAVGQQIPAGLRCIIQRFWTGAPAVSELAAAIELLLPPICTHGVERLLQPRPRGLSSILPRANWPRWASPALRRKRRVGLRRGMAEHMRRNLGRRPRQRTALCCGFGFYQSPDCCSCHFGRILDEFVCWDVTRHIWKIYRVNWGRTKATCFAFDGYFSNY